MYRQLSWDARTERSKGVGLAATVSDRHLPAMRPLTARSVAITALLGIHPPELPVATLIRIGTQFGIAESTTRVALTRMVADGDVETGGGVYRLTDRLMRRQAQQDEIRSPGTRDWDGTWEMAVVIPESRALPDRVALRRHMVPLRLAELRDGVWMRPSNLLRKPAGIVLEQCRFFLGHHDDAEGLVTALWELPAWATEARRLGSALHDADDLTAGMMTAAAVLRHLLLDPVLPPELMPPDWPGQELRDRFDEFSAAYAARLRELGQG
jgi:phenylacetic acid degradation operon negative regulatory protein